MKIERGSSEQRDGAYSIEEEEKVECKQECGKCSKIDKRGGGGDAKKKERI